MEKYNVLIWGTGYWTKKILNHLKNCNIKAFVETQKTKDKFNDIDVISPDMIEHYDFDYVLVCTIYYEQIRQTCKKIGLTNENKVIYLFDESKYTEDSFIYTLFQIIDTNPKIVKYKKWENSKEIMPYISCQKDDICFLFNSKDSIIAESVYKEEFKTFQENDILLFLELTRKYYNINPDGIFFDIGANVGTTSLYVKKCVAPDISIVAFEPSIDNYRLFKANCALNDLNMDKIIIENVAVSNKNEDLCLGLSETNMGDHRIFSSENQSELQKRQIEKVHAINLSDYIRKNNISVDDINYLWIDTQAHEAFVLEGLIDTLTQRKIPMYIEFWVEKLQANNTMDKLIGHLSQIYDSFICIEGYYKGEKTPIPISRLRNYAINCKMESFDMFLM